MFDQTTIHVCSHCGHHLTRHEMLSIKQWTKHTKQKQHRQIPLYCLIRGCNCSNYQEVKF